MRVGAEVAAITASSATTAEIDYRHYYSGQVEIPTGSSLTLLTWWTRSRIAGSVRTAAFDNTPTTPVAITQVVAADKSYLMPVELAGAEYVYAVGNTTGDVYVSKKGE